MSRQTRITDRVSSISGAFVKAIIPHAKLSDEQIRQALIALGINPDECIYCGKERSDWDHLHATTSKKRPSGYFHVMGNLVPSCGKCNQSKSGRHWKKWMTGKARFAPRGADAARRIAFIEALERRHPIEKKSEAELIDVVGESDWTAYWKRLADIEDKMFEAQQAADAIRLRLQNRFLSTDD
jgi:hypothetical protein